MTHHKRLLTIVAAALSATTLRAEDPAKQAPAPRAKALPGADSAYIFTSGISGAPSEPAKPQAYLGIVTGAVPAELTAQLGLPEGFGLLVEDVLADSPAKTAGLEKYDVIKAFNDQQLVNPEQLTALVRGAGKDKEITLTLVRKGQEQHITAKLGERLVADAGIPVLSKIPVLSDIYTGVASKEAREQAKKAHAAADKVLEQALAKDPTTFTEALGDKDVLVIRKDAETAFDMRSARLFLKDEAGSLELSTEKGRRTLVAKDAKGDVVFSGPVDTEEQRLALPADIQKRFDKMNGMLDRTAKHPLTGFGSVSAAGSGSVSTSTSTSSFGVATPPGPNSDAGSGANSPPAPKAQ